MANISNAEQCCADARPNATEVLTKSVAAATESIMGHAKARAIWVKQLDFGYTVEVGCQTFAIQDLDNLIRLVSSYLKNPEELEQAWREGTLKF